MENMQFRRKNDVRDKLLTLLAISLLLANILFIATYTNLIPLAKAEGTVGKALSFDGVDDYAKVLHSPSLAKTPELTVEMWVKRGDTGRLQVPISMQGDPAGYARWQLAFESDDRVRFIFFSSDVSYAYYSASTVGLNWTHIVITYKDNAFVNFYINGLLDKGYSHTYVMDSDEANLVIGNLGDLNWPFKGLIDEVRIYLKALTEDEILAHYNEGIGQYGRTEPGLAAGWHFDEGEGTIAYDYSDNNNDGTIYGATWTDGHVLLPDVAIVDVAPSPIRVLRGQPVTINVTAKNLGGAHENFNVTAYYDNNPIETKIVTNLGKGESTTLTFTWDTTGVDLGYHTIKANATIVQGEINIKNNEMVYGTVWVVKPPVASFTYSPVPAIENRTTTFNAGGSTPNGGIITSYTWDFGDGNVTKTQNPVITHIYASHGTYNVTLTVEDSEGLNGTTWALVEVLRHDVKVVDITPYRNWIYKGWSININVTITNEGNFTEDVTLDLYYNITAGAKIETKSVSIDPGETKTLIFTWDTTDVKACRNYTITAVANIPIESDVSDNILDGPLKVKVRMFGDINGDDKIDMADIAPVAQAFGAFPGHQRWNPDLDLNRNNQVDLRDVAILARNFGKTCP